MIVPGGSTTLIGRKVPSFGARLGMSALLIATFAALTPALSLGPFADTSRLNETPWRRGTRLVDRDGKPWSADDIENGTFYTAFAEGSDPDGIASSVVMIKLAAGDIHLPPERRGWAPEGILAY